MRRTNKQLGDIVAYLCLIVGLVTILALGLNDPKNEAHIAISPDIFFWLSAAAGLLLIGSAITYYWLSLDYGNLLSVCDQFRQDQESLEVQAEITVHSLPEDEP